MRVALTLAACTLVIGHLLACHNGPTTPGAPTPAAPVGTGSVLWSADHESGDLSQWDRSGGGGAFHSGNASCTVSQDVAHSGRHSAKCTIITSGSGTRLFRWSESREHPAGAHYSAWFYFPERYVPSWWNIFQFKSRDGSGANDPFWFLQIGNRPGGAMHLFLYWWNGLTIEGPRQGEFGGRSFTQTLKDVPVGRWTHIEVFLRQSSAFDGHIIVWQDGVELFNLENVRTRYAASNGANEWSVNNYGDGISPTPTTVYIDDAVISTARVGG